MIIIKRLYFILPLMLLTVLTSCVSGTLLDIDTFTEKFNSVSGENICRTDFVSSENGDCLSSYYIFDDGIIINIGSDINTMNIEKLSVTAEKNSDRYEDITAYVICAAYGCDRETAEKLRDEVMKDKENEYANEMRTLGYISLFFTKTKSGERFCLTFNEEIPTETTFQPETAVEYTFETVTSS